MSIATTTLTIPQTRLTLLILWHLLSLDAPTVATLWTIFAARALHTPLPSTLPIAMFLAVWLLYAADRLLDSRVLETNTRLRRRINSRHLERSEGPLYSVVKRGEDQSSSLEPRHLFHRRHRAPFVFAILIASSTLAILVPTLPLNLLRPYLLLAGLLAAWLTLVHLTRLVLPKELTTGLFFAAAVFIPTRANPTAALSFATLCTLNCLYIYRWEHPASSQQKSTTHLVCPTLTTLRSSLGWAPAQPTGTTQPTAPAHLTTRVAIRHLPQLHLAIALLTLASLTPIPIAVSLAALALLMLNHYHHRLPPTTLRAAADLALLTPLLILPFLR